MLFGLKLWSKVFSCHTYCNLYLQQTELTCMVFLFQWACIWSSQHRPVLWVLLIVLAEASWTHSENWGCLKVYLAAFNVFTHLSWPLTPHPTAWPVHRPEHLESHWNKKGKGYIVCACEPGTGGHVPFHRLSWTLPSTWTLRPLISSPQRLEKTACCQIPLLSASEWIGRHVKVLPECCLQF